MLGVSLFARAQNPSVTVEIDFHAGRRPIDPRIYGVAGASTRALRDLNVPLNRYGGNNASRYNWHQNADNRGADWYFESIPERSATAGERGDSFFQRTRAAGAEPMLTVPLIGWIARVGPNRSKLCSFSIAKYGAQTGNDWQWFPDAGNGIRASDGQPITGNDPNDANVPNSPRYQQRWVRHLVTRWGKASAGGVRWYVLDNEPSIWHSTHRDVWPVGATMEQVRDRILEFAGRIKDVDPSALTAGPEEWGWSGFFFSGYDQQWGSLNGWSNLPDRTAHGGWDYLPWLLDQLRRHHQATGRRLLDAFTVHWYPQGGEFSSNTSTAMQLRRNRSTRSLWDPTYRDETWINDYVRLIPRLKGWVAAHYPGTQVGITEYNWGAEGHINGATAQADVLGIFGREGLDLAARWTTPGASTPTYKAIRMYRNYDGRGSTFGNTSVRCSVPDPDSLSAYAAERGADGALTVMVVSKVLSGDTPVTLSLASYASAGVSQVWQLTSANKIVRLADIRFQGGLLAATLPPQSITLFVVHGRGRPAHPRFESSADAPPVARPGQSVVVGGQVKCISGRIADAEVELAVLDAEDALGARLIASGQSFVAGQTRRYRLVWRAPWRSGDWRVRIRVYSAGRARALHVHDPAARIGVQTPRPPGNLFPWPMARPAAADAPSRLPGGERR